MLTQISRGREFVLRRELKAQVRLQDLLTDLCARVQKLKAVPELL